MKAREQHALRAVMGHLRFVVAAACVILAVTSVITLGWSAAKAIDLTRLLLDGGWRTDQALIALLEVIDLILIATVQVIISLGLWELFVCDLDLPARLTVHTLSDLKRSLSEALVLVFAIKFFERLLDSSAQDALYYAVAVALVSGVLVAFAAVSPHRHGDRHRPAEQRAGTVCSPSGPATTA